MEVYELEPLYLLAAPRLESQILHCLCDFYDIYKYSQILIEINIFRLQFLNMGPRVVLPPPTLPEKLKFFIYDEILYLFTNIN